MIEQQATAEMVRTFTGMAYELHPELLKKSWRRGVMSVAKRTKERIQADFAAKYPDQAQAAKRAYGAFYLFKGVSGFAVTTYAHRANAMSDINYYSRWKDGKRKNGVKETVDGREAPLIHWLEHGSFNSNPRTTRFKIGRRPHSTGFLRPLELLAKEEVRGASQVESEILTAIDDAAEKIVRKYEF